MDDLIGFWKENRNDSNRSYVYTHWYSDFKMVKNAHKSFFTVIIG